MNRRACSSRRTRSSPIAPGRALGDSSASHGPNPPGDKMRLGRSGPRDGKMTAQARCGAGRGAPSCAHATKRSAAGGFSCRLRSHHCFFFLSAFALCRRPLRAQTTSRGERRTHWVKMLAPVSAVRSRSDFRAACRAICAHGGSQEAALAVQVLTGVTPNGLRFSASERRVQQPAPPGESFLETMKERPDAESRQSTTSEQKGVWKFCRSRSDEPKPGAFFRIVRSKTTGYVLVVPFPVELRMRRLE